MAFLFKTKAKSPQDLVKSLREAINKLDHLLDEIQASRRSSHAHRGTRASDPLNGPSVNVEPDVVHDTAFNKADRNSSFFPTELFFMRNFPSVLQQLEGEEKRTFDKINEDIAKYLASMKIIFNGDSENDVSPELVSQLAQEIYSQDILALLSLHLSNFEFEARKDVCLIFSTLLKRQIGSRYTSVEHLSKREYVLCWLVLGYEFQDTSLISGMILRECLKHEPLTKALFVEQENCHLLSPELSSILPKELDEARIKKPRSIEEPFPPLIYNLFDYVELPTFDIASDAFASLKELLTRHKPLVADFLSSDYDRFFEKFNKLLESENYITRRQSLKLLGELLLDRTNYESMTKYICVPDHLKLMMNLLRDKSRNIQFEAFHVFKIFVANPNKSKAILDILMKNKEKLINFLSSFQPDRKDDDQFAEEKNYLVRQIEALDEPILGTPPQVSSTLAPNTIN